MLFSSFKSLFSSKFAFTALFATAFLCALIFGVFKLVLAQTILSVCLMAICALVAYGAATAGKFRAHWALASAAVFLWAMCDALWIFNAYFLKAPYESYKFLTAAYLLPTFCAFCAVFIYFYKKLSLIEDKSVLILDGASVFLLIAIMFLDTFLSAKTAKIFSDVSAFSAAGMLLLASLIIFAALMEIFTGKLTNMKISGFYLIAAAGVFAAILLYAFASRLQEAPKAFAYGGALSIIPVWLIAIGALYVKSGDKILRYKSNLFTGSKWLPLITLVPLLIKVQFGSAAMLTALLVLTLYALASYYVKGVVASKNILKRERALHLELERQMRERTNELTLLNLRLRDMLEKDYLTGLTGRGYLISELGKMCENLRYGEEIWVVYVNISRFKSLNSSYGHRAGDQILKIVAKRLLNFCKNDELVARISADEFIAVKKSASGGADAALNFASRIKDEIQTPMRIDRYRLDLVCVAGVYAYAYGDKLTANEIIKNADRAMYYAKENPSFNPALYSRRLDEKTRKNAGLEILMRQANLQSDLEPYFLPVFSLKTGKIIYAQTLIKWRCEQGLLDAEEFFAAAKNNAMLDAVFEQSLSLAARLMQKWSKQGILAPRIAVSAVSDFPASQKFLSSLDKILVRYEIKPHALQLELGESLWMSSPEKLDEFFAALKQARIGVCIDDFGTGYQSLVYIKKYDVARVKIASELTSGAVKSDTDRQIIAAILSMARTMGLKATAKGADNGEILEVLKSLGCDEAQGDALAGAMNAEEFENFILANASNIATDED